MADYFIPRQFLCLLFAAGFASTAVAQQMPGGATPDRFVLAQRAYDAKQYMSARDLLRSFIEEAVGDSRIPAAKKLLIDTWRAAADQFWDQSDYDDAVASWEDIANRYKDDPLAAEMTALARNKVSDKFSELIKHQTFRAAVDLADDYKRSFANEPPLVDADVLQSACAGMLRQALKPGSDAQTTADLLDQALADGATETQLLTGGVSVWVIRTNLADALLKRNELNRAITYAIKWRADCPADVKDKFQKVVSQAMIARAEAYSKLGNLPMLEQALTDMDDPAVSPAGKTTQTRLIDQVKKKAGAVGNAAHMMKIDAPIMTNGKWTDDGAGYAISGSVTLGNAIITVMPGFVVDGGTITIQKGSVQIAGTADSPVILRNVHLEANADTALLAKDAIFEDCTFKMSGQWASRYSSQWTFRNCLLENSNFASLDPAEYGLTIADSVIADCKIPPRFLLNPTPSDGARYYRDEGNQVIGDALIRCELDPSVVWMTQQCFFERCKIKDRNLWSSTTSLTVKLSVPADEMGFVDQLKMATGYNAQGGVAYSATTVTDSKADSLELFKYVGMGTTPPAK